MRLLFLITIIMLPWQSAGSMPLINKSEWPLTDFSKHAVPYSEIISGGPPKDGIPSIDEPVIEPAKVIKELHDDEPVITVVVGEDVRAYPFRILLYHEIVNDVVGSLPLAITYCPLCNSAIVFDRRFKDKVLDFGTTGRLRHSDLIMYDRQTESWWQQFTGKAIVGELTGSKLKMVPSRIETWQSFRSRFPKGKVLVPPHTLLRPYGRNPYAGYDSLKKPFLYDGTYNEKTPALAYVVQVGKDAWPLTLVRKKKEIRHQDLIITWQEGVRSVLDTSDITEGKSIGSVTVQRQTKQGLEDVIYHLPFAFAFKAFYPDGVIHTEE